jgi:hypothetical protein
VSSLIPVPTRAHIAQLQALLAPIAEQMPEPLHFWLPGLYLRVLTLPAGHVVVGKVHRHDHQLAVLRGKAEVVDGFTRSTLSAGYQGLSRAGAKRAIRCLEETTFLTIHTNPTNTRDLAALEAEHIAPEHDLVAITQGAPP